MIDPDFFLYISKKNIKIEILSWNLFYRSLILGNGKTIVFSEELPKIRSKVTPFCFTCYLFWKLEKVFQLLYESEVGILFLHYFLVSYKLLDTYLRKFILSFFPYFRIIMQYIVCDMSINKVP